MSPEKLKELLHAAPFVPFTIVLANRKSYHVGNPDVLSITAQREIIHQDVVGPMTFINPALITEILKPTQVSGA